MKTKLLKISMLIAGLVFVFTAASWADSGKSRPRKYAPEKRIHSKHHDGRSYQGPVQSRHKHNFHNQHKYHYNRHPYHHRPAHGYRHHKFYHRHRWIQKHRPYHAYRHGHHYSHNSYDGERSYNEFSIGATISEPGVEFSIGSKRTW